MADQHSSRESQSRRRFGSIAGCAIAETVSRVAFVGSLLTLADGRLDMTVIAAWTASAATLLRAVLMAELIRAETRDLWAEVTSKLTSNDAVALLNLANDRENTSMLADAVRETAWTRAVMIPSVTGQFVALVVIAVFAFRHFPVDTILLGGGLAMLLLGAIILLHRRRRGAQRTLFRRRVDVHHRLEQMLEGNAELRIQGALADVADRLKGSANAVASEERWVFLQDALLALAPALVAVFAHLLPRGMGESGLGHLALVGGAAALLTVSAAKTSENWFRSAPYRAALARLWQVRTRDGERVAKASAEILPLRLTNVSFAYPAHATMAWNLSLELDRGTGIALVGANGSGKSTLLRVALGLFEPSEGSAEFGPERGASPDLSSSKGRVAYVPTRPHLLEHESVREFLSLTLGETTDEERLSALERFDTASRLRQHGTDILAHPLGALSSGERQRLLLARAFARDVDLLVLDEPEMNLDPASRNTLRGELERAALRSAVIVAIHDTSVIPASFKTIEIDRT